MKVLLSMRKQPLCPNASRESTRQIDFFQNIVGLSYGASETRYYIVGMELIIINNHSPFSSSKIQNSNKQCVWIPQGGHTASSRPERRRRV